MDRLTARRLLPRAGADDRAALAVWGLSRLALVVLSVVGAYALSGARTGQVRAWPLRWQRWDADLFRKVAEFGYGSDAYPDRGVEAFFPGFPLLLRAVRSVVPLWSVSGLLISLVASAVAVVALSRLAALDGVPGRTAVLLLVTSPYALFLFAPYSESLFLALAVPAWLAARRGRWALAGLLAAGACTVRVNGLFLAVALAVLYATSRRRLRPDAGWLLLPLVPLLAYSAYLHRLTGDPLRWLAAQEEGWGRRPTWPWDALANTLRLAQDGRLGAEYALSYAGETACVLVGVVTTAVLLRRRDWASATYVGLSVGALATSTFYLSVSRATLLWFPLWLLLAGAAARRPWLVPVWLATAAPLGAGLVLVFTSGRWVG